MERDSWFLASADSGTLLQELLTQGTELPPVSSGVLPGDGLATWEKLMISIGKNDEVARTRSAAAFHSHRRLPQPAADFHSQPPPLHATCLAQPHTHRTPLDSGLQRPLR